MPSNQLKVSKKVLREFLIAKNERMYGLGFFPSVPKDKEAVFYQRLEEDYMRENVETLKQQKETQNQKRRESYRRAKEVKQEQKQTRAATTIQVRFRKYLKDKYTYNTQYEHALKKTVELFKFGFSKSGTLDAMVENKAAFKEANLPKSLQMVVKYSPIGNETTKIISQRLPTKVAFTAAALYETPAAKEGERLFVKHVHSTHEAVLHESEIASKLKDLSEEIDNQIEDTI